MKRKINNQSILIKKIMIGGIMIKKFVIALNVWMKYRKKILTNQNLGL